MAEKTTGKRFDQHHEPSGRTSLTIYSILTFLDRSIHETADQMPGVGEYQIPFLTIKAVFDIFEN